MEKTNDWTWSKRKYNSISHLQPPTHPNSYRDSWEEQAFAVDAAGGLIGGCVWPPRSYSCSFCRREFRSAQALGGHMNVHRRDRARLKYQSPYPHNVETLHKHQDHDQDHIPNPCTSLGCNPNHPGPDRVVFLSPSLASRVFSPAPLATKENRDERIFLPTISPPNSIENLRIQSTPSSRKNLKVVVCQIHRAGDGEEEEGMSCKRRRTTDSNSSGDRNSTPLQSEVLDQLSYTSTSTEEDDEEEEVDLELRLGYHQPEVTRKIETDI